MTDEQFKAHMVELQRKAPQELAILMWRVIQSSGILLATTDGSEGRDLAVAAQARKHLGLEILSMVEQGQPATHPSGIPFLTILQALREEATQPQEKPKHDRYDRNRDLDDSDD